eukprot:TRINITY_DN1899_c0_g1_i3.p1 TRINITY_DN1899_c0_g1~~TRINITY_DN1899_c0_g1_i3.p1  ORF type:complete len:213 (-),score=22.98 TRINITY_DN1899_c0_g1_i3:320-958(-)
MEGKVIFVTGASAGIGQAIALALGKEQVKICIAARRLERLEKLKGEIEAAGSKCLACKCDVSNRDEVRKAIKATVDAFGEIDVLINNAGVMHLSNWKNVEKHEMEFYSMIDINIKGPLYAISAIIPSMITRKTGHIINISSDAGRKVFPSGSIYCSTKYAMEAYTKGLRLELAQYGIKVTSIQPGCTATEIAGGNSLIFMPPKNICLMKSYI